MLHVWDTKKVVLLVRSSDGTRATWLIRYLARAQLPGVCARYYISPRGAAASRADGATARPNLKSKNKSKPWALSRLTTIYWTMDLQRPCPDKYVFINHYPQL